MKGAKSILAFVVVTVALSSGCMRKAKEEIDFGTFNGSVYRNKYFGMTTTLPSDWSIQDREAMQRIVQRGTEIMAGDSKTLKAVITKASEMQTVNLFVAFKYPVGTPVQSNASISCYAERVRYLSGIKKGRDYLFQAKKMLKASHVEVSFPSEMSVASLGGKEFAVMEVEIHMGGATIHQKYYAATIKGYALVFTTSYLTDEEESTLQDILETITFDPV